MVLDRIEEQERYYSLHPLLEDAFAFLAEASTLAPGRYDIAEGAYANVDEGETTPLDAKPMEAHKRYIDLHYCLAGSERMAWAHVQETEVTNEYDEDSDLYFVSGPSTSLTIKPGTFYIMYPSDAHKAGCHNEFVKTYKKVVVKLPVMEEE